MESKREYSFDRIRIIACLAVVGLHTFSKDLSFFSTCVYYLCGFAIPFFYMISGHFLLNKSKMDIGYIFKKIFKIMKVVVSWNFIVVLIKFFKEWMQNKMIKMDFLCLPKACIKALLQKGFLWHFWYLGILMIVYIFLPIILNLNKKKKAGVLFATGSICLCFDLISILKGYPFQSYFTQTFRVWTCMFYFLCGGGIAQATKIIGTKVNLFFHALGVMIITVINITYQEYAGLNIIIQEDEKRLYAEYFYDNILEMIWIILLFSFLLRINISKREIKIIEKIAPLTLGIYIIHPLVQKVIIKCMGNEVSEYCFIYWLITLCVAMIINKIMRNTYVGKILLKI